MQHISLPGDPDYVVPGSPAYDEHIGCSEVADILGFGYNTPDQLWRKKLHMAPATEHKRIFDRGHAMEAHGSVRVQEFGRILRAEQTQYRDPKRPWLIYHADGMFPMWSALEEGDKAHEGAGMWEFKAPGSNMAAQMARDGMTSGYVCQGQMGMYVAGAALNQPITWGTYGYWDYDEWDLVAFDVASSVDFQKKALEKIDAFWECIQTRTPPPSLEEIETVAPPVVKGELEIITDGDVLALAVQLSELRSRVLDDALATEKTIKAELKALLEPYSVAEVPGIMKFSYRQGKDRVTYDGPGLVEFCRYVVDGHNIIIDQLEAIEANMESPAKIAFDPSHFITTKPGSRNFRPTAIKE